MLHPGDADEFCEHARCPCGGFLETLGEATSGRLRVVRAECLVCERVVNLYFDPATIRH